MQTFLYWLAKAFVVVVQAMPLRLIALIGRGGGAIAHLLDAPHRRVTRLNLRAAFPEKSEPEIRAVAAENFRRLGENYISAIKTASLPFEKALEICPVIGLENLAPQPNPRDSNRIVAIGHFGNFELYSLIGRCLPGYLPATTYRALPQPGLNRLLNELRTRTGLVTFERRGDTKKLLHALNEKGVVIGVLSDQHAGAKGVWAPFFGRQCSTTPAPAIFALRYDSPLNTAFVYRMGLGRWQIEIGGQIPTRVNGQPRTVDEIMIDVNKVFEAAIRRDPANWFWVHKRWKPRPP